MKRIIVVVSETKAQKFTRLAENRTNTVLNNLRLLKQISNKNNYEYTDVQRQKIFSAIRRAVNDADLAFKRVIQKDTFKL